MNHQSPMHVLAGSFPGPEQARAAMADLRDQLDLAEDDVDVASLGGSDPGRAVLAARVREHRLDVAQAVVRRHGGRIVTDVPEDWTGRPDRPKPRALVSDQRQPAATDTTPRRGDPGRSPVEAVHTADTAQARTSTDTSRSQPATSSTQRIVHTPGTSNP